MKSKPRCYIPPWTDPAEALKKACSGAFKESTTETRLKGTNNWNKSFGVELKSQRKENEL